MNEESSIQMDRKRKKQVVSWLVSYPGRFFLFFLLRKKGSSKGQRLAAASFFAYEDKRMAVRVLR